LFTSSINVSIFNASVSTLTLITNITIENNLNLLSGTINLDTGGNLTLESDAVIEITGGELNVTGGSVSFPTSYSVIYSGSTSVATGVKISGMSLTDLTIDVGSGQTVTINNDIQISGMLSTESGILELNGNNLEVTGDISASGEGELSASIPGTDISVSSVASISGDFSQIFQHSTTKPGCFKVFVWINKNLIVTLSQSVNLNINHMYGKSVVIKNLENNTPPRCCYIIQLCKHFGTIRISNKKTPQ